jgi:hypothetical protein
MAHLAPSKNVKNADIHPLAQFTAGGGSLAVFNENENVGRLTARSGKGGLGGVPKRALQDVTNATQQSSGIVGKKQVRPRYSCHSAKHCATATTPPLLLLPLLAAHTYHRLHHLRCCTV